MSKPSEEFEQAYDNFLAGCDVDTTMLDCAEFMFNAGRESVGQAEPVAQPYAHIYEFDSAVFGTHRSFSPSQWNGMKPTRTVAVYTQPAQPVQPDFSDAYQGAREDAEIWKKRALEAEELNRKFIADINGPTFMGEPAQPVQPAGAANDEFKRTLEDIALIAHHGGLVDLSESDALTLIRKATAKYHDWNQTVGRTRAELAKIKGGV